MQKRYGWTDEHVLSMPFSRLMGIVDIIIEDEKQQALEGWRKTAFIGYQSKEFEKEVTFREYCESMGITEESFGLVEPKKVKVETGNVVSKEEALAAADRALALLKA